MANTQVILIDGATLTLPRVEAILQGAKVVLATNIQKKIEASHTLVKQQASGFSSLLGINTGALDQRLTKSQLKSFQLNLLRSHAAGYGAPLSIPESRLALCLKLNTLVKGFSGVNYKLIQALFNLIKAEIIPVIPEHNSSCAHLALVLIGEGDVHYHGKIIPAAEALKAAALEPIELHEKEALSLINGPHLLLAKVTNHLCQANSLLLLSYKIAALTFEALEGSVDSLHPLLHEAREQPAQMAVAEIILEQLTGSALLDREKHRWHPALATLSQTHGAAAELLALASQWIEHELNAALDNPLVFPEQRLILQGGNTDPTVENSAASLVTMALEILMKASASRIRALLDEDKEAHFGYQAFSTLIPETSNIENCRLTLVLEMLAAAHAIDRKKIHPLANATQKVYTKLRTSIPKMSKERILTPDIEKGLLILKELL